jgi:hypothetical protein
MWTALNEDEMALNQNDRDWIRLTIGESLTQHSRRKLERLKSWSPLGAAVAIGIFILIQWNGYTIFRVQTEVRLDTLELSSRALRSAQEPAKEKNQIAAKAVIAEAKKKSIRLPGTVVEDAGESFIEASKTEPKAWGVALDFIAYRSDLNVSGLVDLGEYPGMSYSDIFRGFRIYASWRLVPFEHGAIDVRLGDELKFKQDMEKEYRDRIGKLPQEKNIYAQYVMAVGKGTTSLLPIDGLHFRNVVLKNARVVYSGGPILLENVKFIDCTFDLPRNEDTMSFARSVLQTQEVAFSKAD